MPAHPPRKTRQRVVDLPGHVAGFGDLRLESGLGEVRGERLCGLPRRLVAVFLPLGHHLPHDCRHLTGNVWPALLDQVYSVVRELDQKRWQNVMLYLDDQPSVEVGVGGRGSGSPLAAESGME